MLFFSITLAVLYDRFSLLTLFQMILFEECNPLKPLYSTIVLILEFKATNKPTRPSNDFSLYKHRN